MLKLTELVMYVTITVKHVQYHQTIVILVMETEKSTAIVDAQMVNLK